MGTLLDLDHATVVRQADGSVDIIGNTITVTVRIDTTTPTPRITTITVHAHTGGYLRARDLASLPLGQITQLAAAHIGYRNAGHPNESYWRALARPKTRHRRSWDTDHWLLVWDVFWWAQSTGRPGGGYRAVADLWGVTQQPTAYRWVHRARQEHERQEDRDA